MARQKRIEFPGAFYHITSRGDRRENIFLDGVDRHDFLKTLAEACVKTGWGVHAYCLLPNHFHLVVETPNPNLVVGMSWFLSAYTIRLNRRHKMVGHVFSGRYKAVVVEGANGYLKTACDYVHLNPIRAGLIKAEDRLISFPWTSLAWYLAATEHRPPWLCVDRLLREHGILQHSPAGRREFESRMESLRHLGQDPAAVEELRHGWCLGSPAFRNGVLDQIDGTLLAHHAGPLRRQHEEAKADRILAEEFKRLGWEESELTRRRKNDPQKLAIAARLRRETTLSLKRIAAKTALGSPKSANANLHRWLQAHGRTGSPEGTQEGKTDDAPTRPAILTEPPAVAQSSIGPDPSDKTRSFLAPQSPSGNDGSHHGEQQPQACA